MSTKTAVNQTKAAEIRKEEIEAAALEGSVEATPEEYELYLDIKEREQRIAEDLAAIKASKELLKERQVDGKITHLTFKGVELTTLSTTTNSKTDMAGLIEKFGQNVIAGYINKTKSFSFKVK